MLFAIRGLISSHELITKDNELIKIGLRFMLDLQMPFYRLEPLIFQHYLNNHDITVFV